MRAVELKKIIVEIEESHYEKIAKLKFQLKEAQSALADEVAPFEKLLDEELDLYRNGTKESGPGIAVMITKGIEVVNPGLVPREFLDVDEVAIKKHLRSVGWSEDIPGIKVVKKTTHYVKLKN